MPATENQAKSGDVQPKAVVGSENPRDYREADQTADFVVNMAERAVIKPENTKSVSSGKGGKKGSKDTSSSDAKRKTAIEKETKFNFNVDSPEMRRVQQCGNCLNPMTMSEKVNKHELEGKKVPKNPNGKGYKYKSPGAAEGRYMTPLCDDCEKKYQKGENVSFRHAVVINSSGVVRNIPAAQLDFL